MKLLFSIFFFCFMTLPCFAQDSLKAASTLSFKPLVGLGLLNGARGGLQIQYNDIIAIEGGVGISVFSFKHILAQEFTKLNWLISHGIIVTPLEDKRLSFHQYITYYRFILTEKFRPFIQVGLGWLISIGKISNLRISSGIGGNDLLPISPILTLDFTVIFDGVNIRL